MRSDGIEPTSSSLRKRCLRPAERLKKLATLHPDLAVAKVAELVTVLGDGVSGTSLVNRIHRRGLELYTSGSPVNKDTLSALALEVINIAPCKARCTSGRDELLYSKAGRFFCYDLT